MAVRRAALAGRFAAPPLFLAGGAPPVAAYNAEQSMENARKQMEAAALMSGPEVLALMAPAAGPAAAWEPAGDVKHGRSDLNIVAAGADAGWPEVTPGAFRAIYELDEGGAALIRPDGHVAARWRSRPDDPAAELARVADQVRGTGVA